MPGYATGVAFFFAAPLLSGEMAEFEETLRPSAGAAPPFSTKDSFALHKELLDNLYDAVYFVDVERRITYWNKAAERMTGYSAEESVGRYCFDNFLQHVSEEGKALCLDGCPLASTVTDGLRREDEVFLRHKLGHRIPVSIRVAPIADGEGAIIGAVEVFTNISEKKRVERRARELEGLAFRDALTNVSNRRFIELKVKQAIQEVEHVGRRIGLLMIDVDHFKSINDMHGHEAGDLVLRTFCDTLVQILRPTDVIGRWGGDEFLVLAMDVSAESLLALAERSRMLVAHSSTLVRSQILKITVSVGATFVLPGESDEALIQRADRLMYASKASGRNCVTVG
jgi:diguanylate cyclase (GGDEF)-like protein/PAS domain S-box-containing protein